MTDKHDIKLFVVDDNETFLSAAAASLKKKFNCEVYGFTSAEECLKHLDEKPDIIFSDYYLDEAYAVRMNGDKFLSAIKNQNHSIPVIIYSSHLSVELALNTIKMGAEEFVVKDSMGIQKISLVAARFIRRMQLNYSKKIEKRHVITLVSVTALFIALVFTTSKVAPELLPYLFVSALVIAMGGHLLLSAFHRTHHEEHAHKNIPGALVGNG